MEVWGLLIIALSLAHFYRFARDSGSRDPRRRAGAGWWVVTGALCMLGGAGIVSRASQPPGGAGRGSASAAVTGGGYARGASSTSFTVTDPRTGQPETRVLSRQEEQDYQRDPGPVTAKVMAMALGQR